MAEWTTPDDVIDAWIGEDAPSDKPLIATWIGKAERQIRFRVPGIQARIDEDEVDLGENVIDVVTSMVQRVFRNPEGVRTRQTSTGPYSDSVTMGGDQPGSLWLTDEELALLAPNRSLGQRAFSVDLLAPSSDDHPLFGALINGPDSWAPEAS